MLGQSKDMEGTSRTTKTRLDQTLDGAACHGKAGLGNTRPGRRGL